MAIEEVSIKEKSDLIVSQKSKRTYFTVVDMDDRKLICFNPRLHDQLVLGKIVQLDIQPGKMADDTLRIANMVGEKTPEEEKPKPTEEHAPQELGMWWKELGEWLRLWYGHKDKPTNYELLKTCYFAQLFSVLPIKSSKKEE